MLDNKDLQNINKTLAEMDRLLISNAMHVEQVGKKLKDGLNSDSINELIGLLNKKDRQKAFELRAIFTLTDENGNPINVSEIQKAYNELSKKLAKKGTRTYKNKNLGIDLTSRDQMENQSSMWEKQLEFANMSPVKQYMNAAKLINDALGEQYKHEYDKQKRIQKEMNKLELDYLKTKNKIQERQRSSTKISQKQIEKDKERLNVIRKRYSELNKESKLINKSGSRGFTINQLSSDRRLGINNEMQRHLDQMNRSIKDTIPLAQKLGRTLAMAFSINTIKNFATKLINIRGEFEKQQVALRTLLGNKNVADEIYNKTLQQALSSPFTAQQLITYTKQLSAYRIESSKLFDTTKRLADISAGLGVDMDRLILAYGQVKSANFLRASEVRQFTEAGVNVYAELAQYFTELKGTLDELPKNKFTNYLSKIKGETVSVANVIDMVTKRLVRFEDVEEIFKRITNEGGAFYNMQYVLTQTLSGQMAKLKDMWDQLLNTIGQNRQGLLKGLVGGLSNFIQEWRTISVIASSSASLVGFGMLTNSLVNINEEGSKFKETFNGVKTLFSREGLFSKGGLIGMGVGVVMALVTAMIQLNRNMKMYNSRIEENILNLSEQKDLLEGYSDSVKKNNKIINELGEKTERTKDEEEKLNDAMKENRSIVASINKDYPELMENTELHKNGIVELTSALDKYNSSLERSMVLQLEMLQDGWFDQAMGEDARQLKEGALKAKGELMVAQQEAKKLLALYEAQEKSGLDKGVNLTKGEIQALRKIISINTSSDIGKANVDYNYYRNQLTGKNKGRFKSISFGKEYNEFVFNELKEFQSTFLATLTESVKNAYGYAFTSTGMDVVDWLKSHKETIKRDTEEGLTDVFKETRELLISQGSADTEYMQQLYNNKLLGLNSGLDIFLAPTEKSNPNLTEEEIEEKNKKTLELWKKRMQLLERIYKKYKELANEIYTEAEAEKNIRNEFDAAWIMYGMPFSFGNFDFTKDNSMGNAFKNLQDYLPDDLKKEAEVKASEYYAKWEMDVEIRNREEFARQMDEMFGRYELSIEMSKLNIPENELFDIFGIESVNLSQLRNKINDFMKEEGVKFGSKDFQEYLKYLNKIDDLENKRRNEKIKEYSKLLEQEFSERAKIEMEYIKDIAELESSSYTEEQRKAIRKGLDKRYEEQKKDLEWKEFKESEYYIEMMEDLTKRGSESLGIMRDKLEDMKKNGNLSPRAMKEIVNALEKMDEIERERRNPFERWYTYLEELKYELKGKNIKKIFSELANEERKIIELQSELDVAKALHGIAYLRESAEAGKSEIGKLIKDDATTITEYEALIVERERQLKQLTKPSQEDRAKYEKYVFDKNQLESELSLLRKMVEYLMIIKNANGEGYGSILSNESREDVNKKITDLEKQLSESKGTKKSLDDIIEKWDKFNKAGVDSIDEINKYLSSMQDLISTLSSELPNLGVNANKSFDTTFDGIRKTLSNITTMLDAIKEFNTLKDSITKAGGDFWDALKSSKGVSLITIAVNLLIELVSWVAQLKNAHIDDEIERISIRMERLNKAYERLNEELDKATTTTEYMRKYTEATEILTRKQMEAQKQLTAALSRKNRDTQEVSQFMDELNEINNNLEDLQNNMLETFGGVVDKNSFVSGFVSAWQSAFQDVGDGLDGLKEHFNEFLNEWFQKQATMNIAGKVMGGLIERINNSITDDGIVDWSELEDVRSEFERIAPELSERLEDFWRMFGNDKEGSLSGLAQSVQGMSESTAEVLGGYMNSIRMDVSTMNVNIASIVEAFRSPSSENPILSQLKSMSQSTQAIQRLLESVTKSNHPNGGYGIKVFA